VEVDGALCQLIPSPGFMPPRPIRVPIVLAASGPRGYQVAREVAYGIINPVRPPGADFPEYIQSAWGTVLAEGEDLTAPRVRAAAGAAIALRYHMAYEYGRAHLPLIHFAQERHTKAQTTTLGFWEAQVERDGS